MKLFHCAWMRTLYNPYNTKVFTIPKTCRISEYIQTKSILHRLIKGPGDSEPEELIQFSLKKNLTSLLKYNKNYNAFLFFLL